MHTANIRIFLDPLDHLFLCEDFGLVDHENLFDLLLRVLFWVFRNKSVVEDDFRVFQLSVSALVAHNILDFVDSES